MSARFNPRYGRMRGPLEWLEDLILGPTYRHDQDAPPLDTNSNLAREVAQFESDADAIGEALF